jgi:ATP phosphoribosyltransferase regulatory subunit
MKSQDMTGDKVELRALEGMLAALFEEAGYSRREPAMLQPADIFVDFSGEDIRRRLFMTEGPEGQSLCLRPEFTIPLSLGYLEDGGSAPADLYASGPVFRQRSGESGEFVQIGVERFGHAASDVTDAECFALAMETLARCGVNVPRARIGDVGLLSALLDQLAVSPAARRRLIRTLGKGGTVASMIDRGASEEHQPFSGVMRMLEGAAPSDAKALVKDMLAIAGIDKVGGRDSDAIADRFLRRAAGETALLSPKAAETLEAYLEIAGEPDHAIDALRAFAEEEEVELDAPIALIESRIGFIAAQGVSLGQLRFETGFLRNLDYYTGFVFDMPSDIPGKPMIGGGRYDSLMRRLGAGRDVPAIGFALWPERLPEPVAEPLGERTPGDAP